MRMKFNKSRQMLLATAVSLLAAGLMTACGTLTTDFVFVASSKAAGPYNYGEIDVFEINSVSGAMRQIPTSPFPSGGRNPVAEAVSSDSKNLYVVNQDDNTIVQFGIGSDGKLYPQSTVNTPAIYPLAVAVNGSNLFVVDTYQPLATCSSAEPCSGSVSVFPIQPASGSGSNAVAGGGLLPPVANGSLNYWPLTLPCSPSDVLLPTGINVLATGDYVYVTAFDTTAAADDIASTANTCDSAPKTYNAPTGYVFGFTVNSSGALTAIGGSPFAVGSVQTTSAGVVIVPHPSAIASYSNQYVYITDFNSGNVHGYTVASGALSELSGSPYPTGNQPAAIVADPNYPFVYAANSLDGTVSAYSVSSGILSTIGTYDAGSQPVAMGIDPSTSHFLFTANFLGSDVSDFELSTTAGTLIDTQRSPYAATAQPTAVAAIAHGSAAK
jgi:6-phosphogluconolactonase (cycloisomerase 2 family)